jgi:hypothetical protein
MYGKQMFDVGKSDHHYMTLSDFFDLPLDQRMYIFDPKFGEKNPALLSDYQVPEYFERDFMAYFSSNPLFRPYYRWLLIGKAESGFGLHVDPNGTSAWNALVYGRKRWVTTQHAMKKAFAFEYT